MDRLSKFNQHYSWHEIPNITDITDMKYSYLK